MAHAVLVTSPVGPGTIRGFDVATARAATGVIAVLSHLDKPVYPELTRDVLRAAGAAPSAFSTR